MTLFDILVHNYGNGPQNTVTGSGPQFNNNIAGAQNNYYGALQDPQFSEAELFSWEKKVCLRSLIFPNMNARRHDISDAHPDTCDWLFRTTEFEKWRDRRDLSSHNGVLWIKGKPGAGKSTLMNHTLCHCEEIFSNHLIAVYFFNARGGGLEKTPLGMLQSIVYQIIIKDDELCKDFLNSYREKRMMCNGEQSSWRQSELKKFIQSIVKQPQLQSKPLLLLVDALDECDEEHIRDVVDFFETLSVVAVRVGVELRICLSSRHYPRISMKKTLEITVEMMGGHTGDIVTYIKEKLLTDEKHIKDHVQEKASGIFMWVVLVVVMLNKAFDEGRGDGAMWETLKEVPGDLEGVFNSLLEKDSSNRAELVKMLQWVLFSQRPLSPEELYIASVEEPLPSSRWTIQRRIINSSKGLIEVRDSERGEEIVQFIHQSVYDFLHRYGRLQALDPTLEPDAIGRSHLRLWVYCWSYFEPHDTTLMGRGSTMERSDQFLQYATMYVLGHADEVLSKGSGIRSRHEGPIARWLRASDEWARWRKSFGDSGTHMSQCMGPNNDATLVSIFAWCGYRNLLKLVLELEEGADVNVQSGSYGNALQASLLAENCEATELLLENGADVNAQSGRYDNALHTALSVTNYDITKLLLEYGADVNARIEFYGGALQAALFAKNFKIAKLLLANGANVNMQGGYFGNALQIASYVGSYEMAKLLIMKGADVNIQGGYFGNALQAASYVKSLEITELLLKNGANVNAQGGRYETALKAASYSKGYEVRILLHQWGASY
ncbi:hypothetical protein F5Y10DRAFT_195407 [Nemania abortiva]|nr:hypothetical protein F5Y10DRAFT_195407 [Nemania abortiva]